MGWFGKKKKAENQGDRTSFVWSKNMQLRVAVPQAEGWQRLEAAEHADGLLAAFKCVKGAPPQAVALDAYVYQDGDTPTLAQLEQRDWRAHFASKMFAKIDDIDVRRVQHAARSGFRDEGVEVEVKGRLREPDMVAVLRERHVPAGSKLLVVSAVCGQPEVGAAAKLIDSWLTHATLGGD